MARSVEVEPKAREVRFESTIPSRSPCVRDPRFGPARIKSAYALLAIIRTLSYW